MKSSDCGEVSTQSASAQRTEPKLLDRVREAVRLRLRLRHYSRRTEEAYVTWIRRFIIFHGKKHPSLLGKDEIVRYLTWLAVQQQVSASTQNQALSALLFLYRQVLQVDPGAIDHVPHAQGPVRVPVVLSLDEVRAVLKQLTGVSWLIVSLFTVRACDSRNVSSCVSRTSISNATRSSSGVEKVKRTAERCCPDA
jgi:integrase